MYNSHQDLSIWEIRVNGKTVKKIYGRKSAERYANKCTGNLFGDRNEVNLICVDTGEWLRIV